MPRRLRNSAAQTESVTTADAMTNVNEVQGVLVGECVVLPGEPDHQEGGTTIVGCSNRFNQAPFGFAEPGVATATDHLQRNKATQTPTTTKGQKRMRRQQSQSMTKKMRRLDDDIRKKQQEIEALKTALNNNTRDADDRALAELEEFVSGLEEQGVPTNREDLARTLDDFELFLGSV